MLLRFLPLFLLVPAIQAADSALLAGPNIRVEARIAGGKLEERYFARSGGGWVLIATAAGESAGAVTLRGAGAEVISAPAESIVLDRNRLIERLAANGATITRTITLDSREGWLQVSTRLEPGPAHSLHSFADSFAFAQKPDWSYSPSIGGFNPDSQYKAPVILTQAGGKAFAIVPDLAALDRATLKRCNHSLELDVPAGPRLSAGFLPARMAFHSVFALDEERTWSAGAPVTNSYYLMVTATAPAAEAYREAVRFHWQRFGRPAQTAAADEQVGTDAAYKSLALWDDWRKQVWDKESPERWLSMELDGAAAGGVRTLRWGGPKPSVYLSAWFNSMRTAFGMALYARRTNNRELLDLARQTVELALRAPGRDGAFKCIAVSDGDKVIWAAGDGSGASLKNGYLGFDMAWTAYWLLKWRAAGLPSSEQILARSERLADFLVERQQPDGMIPTRFDESGAVRRDLSRQVFAETAPAALFLLELAAQHRSAQDRNARYQAAALRALQFLEREVIPERKWFDFETFFSCSPRLVSFDPATGQWPANNLALIHAPAAFLAAYRATGRKEFLERGTAVLDYLLLTQQCWTNPALENLSCPNMLLGGFTTQNSDAEWSDARQSLAANVILDYYRATGMPEYLERGVAALRSQFPISPSENWAHSGYGKKAGVSSFHWGTGSGMAGVEIEEEYLRDVAVDVTASRAAGVNGINVESCEVGNGRIAMKLSSPFRWARPPVASFHRVPAEGRYRLSVNGRDAGEFTAAELKKGVAVGRVP